MSLLNGVPDPVPDQFLVVASAETAATLAAVREQARDYAQGSKAPNTRRAYRADWADFTAWCRAHDRSPLPALPETVAFYLSALADYRALPIKSASAERSSPTSL